MQEAKKLKNVFLAATKQFAGLGRWFEPSSHDFQDFHPRIVACHLGNVCNVYRLLRPGMRSCLRIGDIQNVCDMIYLREDAIVACGKVLT